MTKQQFLLAILDKLQDDRLPAIGIKILLEADQLDDDIIDTIIEIFQQTAAETENATLRSKLTQGISTLNHLKDLETQERLHDLEEIARLEQMIEKL